MAPTPDTIAAALLAQRRRFKAFVTARLNGNESEAEDLLQNSLVKALQRADGLRDFEHLNAWFYQVLRRSIVDHVRARQAADARELAWTESLAADALDDERIVCRCFESLLHTLNPRHAVLLHLVELDGTSVAAAAIAVGVTANHASVLLHRARAELRGALEAFCGECAKVACLDCTCSDSPA